MRYDDLIRIVVRDDPINGSIDSRDEISLRFAPLDAEMVESIVIGSGDSAARFVGAAFPTGKTREHTVDPPQLLVGRMFISLEKRRSHPRTKDS